MKIWKISEKRIKQKIEILEIKSSLNPIKNILEIQDIRTSGRQNLRA
jgi:hypothetical protein